MFKKNKTIIIGESGLCKKCGNRMITKAHKDLTNQKKQKQYFTQWDYCLSCNAVWFNPEFLVINDTSYYDAIEQVEEMNSLFKNNL